MSERQQSEFRRLIGIDNIDGRGHTFSIQASAEERKALARRFGVLSVESLSARGTLAHGANQSRFCLLARLEAEVAQKCIISLERVVQRIDAKLSREYDTDASDDWSGADESVHEIFLSLDSDDRPDPVVEGSIDVGEAVAEHLALELDPFPRASGANLNEMALSYGDIHLDDETTHPFAALATVKANLKKDE